MLTGTGIVLSVALPGCTLNNDSVESAPVDVVETYLTSLGQDDPETANEYAHEDGEYFIPDESPDNAHLRAILFANSLTIVELTEITRETAVREMWHRVLSESPDTNLTGPDEIDDDLINQTVAKERATVEESLQETYDFEEHAYVLYEVQLDKGRTVKMAILLFQIDSQWIIWGPHPEIIWF